VAHDHALLRTELRTALRPLLGLGALGAVGTFLFADLAVSIIYGSRGFAPAGAILKAFSPALFLVCVDVLFASAVMAVGRPRALAVAKTANLAVCTGLALLLVPWAQARHGNGGIGLVLAFGASEVIMFGAAVALMPRATLDSAFVADVGRAVAAGGLTLLLFRLVPPLPPVAGVPLCVAAFAAAAAALGLVRRGELRAFGALLRRRGE
jgi:O-antigen/teichoic acid export membrane protein